MKLLDKPGCRVYPPGTLILEGMFDSIDVEFRHADVLAELANA